MSAHKEEKFDSMLYQALRKHSEPIPAGFTDRMLRQIREAEEQKILACVIMEERLALAGCIVLGIMAIVVMAVFPGVAVGFKELVAASIYKITRTMETVRYDWQSYAVLAGVLGFAVYSLADLFVGDN
jgi:hypothetical protein